MFCGMVLLLHKRCCDKCFVAGRHAYYVVFLIAHEEYDRNGKNAAAVICHFRQKIKQYPYSRCNRCLTGCFLIIDGIHFPTLAYLNSALCFQIDKNMFHLFRLFRMQADQLLLQDPRIHRYLS